MSTNKLKNEPKKEHADPAESDSDGDGDTNAGRKMHWTDDLTWSLISAIESNAEIKKGLYPPPGSNVSTAKGGGKPKTDFHVDLARKLFEDHPKYSAAFAVTKTDAKALAAWGQKIKNRIKKLEQQTRYYVEEMGETGKGITAEEELDMSLDNELTNKWFVIKSEFPFLLNMKKLIMQRPNIMRTGIGNAQARVETGLLLRSRTGGDSSGQKAEEAEEHAVQEVNPFISEQPPQAAGGVPSTEPPAPTQKQKRKSEALDALFPASDAESSEADDDDDRELQATAAAKRAASTPAPASKPGKKSSAKKTPACSGISTPAAKGSAKSSSKKLKYSDQFSDMALAEELTRQKSLEVQLARAKLEKERVAADKERVAAKVAAKVEKDRMKLELAKLQMQQEHELAMAAMKVKMARAQQPGSTQGRTFPTSHFGFDSPLQSDPLDSAFTPSRSSSIPGSSRAPSESEPASFNDGMDYTAGWPTADIGYGAGMYAEANKSRGEGSGELN